MLEKKILKKINKDCYFKFEGFNIVNEMGYTPLMHYLIHECNDHMGLTAEELDYLINNSDMNVISGDGSTCLNIALKFNDMKYVDLTENQFNVIYNGCKNIGGWDINECLLLYLHRIGSSNTNWLKDDDFRDLVGRYQNNYTNAMGNNALMYVVSNSNILSKISDECLYMILNGCDMVYTKEKLSNNVKALDMLIYIEEKYILEGDLNGVNKKHKPLKI